MVKLIQESRFRLDGGAMFGHVPKVVWSRLIETDAANRIQLACNILLHRHPSGAVVLVETGMGTRWNEKERAFYELVSTDVPTALRDAGVQVSDVTHVILTHLHLDHAGGATMMENGSAIPAFPNARYFVQRGEWEAANNPDIRSSPSYRPDDFRPLMEHGVLELQDGDGEILPGISVRKTPGHTLHHQSVRIEADGQMLWYLGDIFPTSRHLKPNYVMGFDLYPLEVMRTREALLEELLEPNTIAIFEHDADTPSGRVQRDGARVTLVPEQIH